MVHIPFLMKLNLFHNRLSIKVTAHRIASITRNRVTGMLKVLQNTVVATKSSKSLNLSTLKSMNSTDPISNSILSSRPPSKQSQGTALSSKALWEHFFPQIQVLETERIGNKVTSLVKVNLCLKD